MTWRLAKSLDVLRSQVNALVPNRSKMDDGTIGDESHSQRESDHNPDSHGVVTAMDLTHDPGRGLDSYVFADELLRAKDGRIKYVISNRRIASGAGQEHEAWVWRHYDGASPHDEHVHISVKDDAAHADAVTPWALELPTPLKAWASQPPKQDLPRLSLGAHNTDVQTLQGLLNANGARLLVDGEFGPLTDAAVRSFQGVVGLATDGVVGGYTWRALQAGIA